MTKFVKLFELFVILSTATLISANQCGKGYGKCPEGYCCSIFGWCGASEYHCGANCQPEYGKCNMSINNPNGGKNIVDLDNEKDNENDDEKDNDTSKDEDNSKNEDTSKNEEPTIPSIPSIPSTSESSGSCENSKSIIIYYAEWKYYTCPPSSLPFDKLTHINYAFADIDSSNFSLIYESSKFKELISAARSKNKNIKVLMSVGGWTYSGSFSKMASSESNRKKFVKSVKSMLDSTNADGVDIDWEYPGSSGFTDNYDAANDTKNLLKLIKELREAIGSKLITAAVSHNTFSVNGSPLSDLSEYAKIFDFVNIMTYDFAGSWSSVISHQSSLYPSHEDDTGYSLTGAVKNWMNAGFPAKKIVVGIPAYGRSWISSSSSNNGYLQRPSNSFPKGDEEDYVDSVSNKYSGVWKYKNLRKSVLKSSYKKSSGSWERLWDSKASAPYLFNKDTKQFITYDDPESVSLKAKYVNENKLGGMMMWEIEEDTKDSELITTMYDNLASCSGSDINLNTGNKHIVNTGLDVELPPENGTKVTTTRTTTIKATSTSAPSSKACPNSPQYKCCESCYVSYEDNYKWGVLNNEWCSLTYECIDKIKKCWSEAYGYPCCSKCTTVRDRSNNKKWGIENNNWCGIPDYC